MNKECSICHGQMTQKLVIYSQLFEGEFIFVENVPAFVCEQCGDVLYDPDIVEKLQNHIWSHPEPTRSIIVPVFDLALAA